MTDRITQGLALRELLARRDAGVPASNQATNGDETRYSDRRATYTKGLTHFPVGTPAPNVPGLVEPASYDSFKIALLSGEWSDFERIQVGPLVNGSAVNPGKGRLNGPQGGLAYYLTSPDAKQFLVPSPPALASLDYAVELIEVYWASLAWAVPFANYGADPTIAAAAAELTANANHYAGPKTPGGQVTPQLLFRGPFVGEQAGPYVSSLLTLPAQFGALTVNQSYATLQPPTQYMITAPSYINVQNGLVPAFPAPGPAAPIHNGAGLAAYTHSDVLYQAYLIANQVLDRLGHPANAGIPYSLSMTQKPFATLGGPDVSALIGYVADEALKAVWWQKWFVHLRHRPEAGGYLVNLQHTAGFDPTTPSAIVRNSQAVANSAAAHGGSFLLPQAFPEGSPTHPAYPTGHGAVAGACITVLKFFWDGDKPVQGGGGSLNGELHKLASNISFGHGIFAGIHWRSDTVESITLGEKVALAVLEDRVRSYNEPVCVTITRLEGTPYTITNR
jgi:hypothetical protein